MPENRRAQTTIDFLVGMSVFLLTVGFVFSFVPAMFQPFETDTGSYAVVADRGAATLTEGLLGSPDDPAVLDDTCAEGFFDLSAPDPPGCRYAVDASDLQTALGTGSRVEVNVTIEGDSGIESIDGTTLAAGPTPPATADVNVARRVVFVDDTYSTLYVRVW